MFNLGPWEVGLILVVALIVVGPGKLPEVAKAIGKGMNDFKRAAAGYQKEFQEAINSIEDTVKDKESGSSEAIKPASSIDEMANKFDAVVKDDSGENPHPNDDSVNPQT